MDAKSRAEFINSVAKGKTMPCPNCDTQNEPENTNCSSCGKEIIKPEMKQEKKTAFNKIKEDEKEEITSEKYIEPNKVFAQGLPNWSLEPPMVVIRRR